MDACIDLDTAAALLDGRLSRGQQRGIDDHLGSCGSCRGLVLAAADGRARPSRASGPTAGDDLAGLPSPGDVIGGRFRIERRLGRGAMGVVFAAWDETLGVRIALKVLGTAATAAEGPLPWLRRELVLGRRITHRNVCRVHDLGTSGGLAYVSMELLEGETLAARLARAPLAPCEALPILSSLCDALAAAHACGVVHRDLKPANVMVCWDGRVAVMDFGLARDLEAGHSPRGARVGTPAYWAPEQARGEDATASSDVYAMGVIAAELLTGRRPRYADDPSLSTLPRQVAAAVQRCLARRPEDRWPSAEALGHALAAAFAPRRRWAHAVLGPLRDARRVLFRRAG